MEYLKKIPEEDLKEFYKRFDASEKAIRSKGEDLHNWCKINGKVKKDYKAFLLNALKKDFPERVNQKPVVQIRMSVPEEKPVDQSKIKELLAKNRPEFLKNFQVKD